MTDLVLDSGAGGAFSRVVDTAHLPFSPPVVVQPGETWYFQAWFRDANPGPPSNRTDGLAVSFD